LGQTFKCFADAGLVSLKSSSTAGAFPDRAIVLVVVVVLGLLAGEENEHDDDDDDEED
jgi:hypothetical protein